MNKVCIMLCVLSSCLRSWLEQDTSCPTCRMSLNISEGGEGRVETDVREPGADNMAVGLGADARLHLNQLNHFFHFDGETQIYVCVKPHCSAGDGFSHITAEIPSTRFSLRGGS